MGATMPMWRVQTEGYLERNDMLVGVVSSDSGFLDSPDTEWISGGVNTKRPKAVALGRHGNFFHWGFAASPTYMTAEAKLVFVNAIHYISKFDGQAPIARREPGASTRNRIEDALARISEKGYARELEQHRYFVERIKERNADIQARLDRWRGRLRHGEARPAESGAREARALRPREALRRRRGVVRDPGRRGRDPTLLRGAVAVHAQRGPLPARRRRRTA